MLIRIRGRRRNGGGLGDDRRLGGAGGGSHWSARGRGLREEEKKIWTAAREGERQSRVSHNERGPRTTVDQRIREESPQANRMNVWTNGRMNPRTKPLAQKVTAAVSPFCRAGDDKSSCLRRRTPRWLRTKPTAVSKRLVHSSTLTKIAVLVIHSSIPLFGVPSSTPLDFCTRQRTLFPLLPTIDRSLLLLSFMVLAPLVSYRTLLSSPLEWPLPKRRRSANANP
jgi:hypothetical protein